MELSRSSTPEAPPQDLWSSILDSVSSSRSIPSKQILLLGQPSSGKSAIASALLQKQVSDEQKDDQRSDFAIGYDFADVRDEADEGELPRTSHRDFFSSISYRYPRAAFGIHCTLFRVIIYRVTPAFFASTYIFAPNTCYNCARLDTALDIRRRVGNMAKLGGDLVKG